MGLFAGEQKSDTDIPRHLSKVLEGACFHNQHLQFQPAGYRVKIGIRIRWLGEERGLIAGQGKGERGVTSRAGWSSQAAQQKLLSIMHILQQTLLDWKGCAIGRSVMVQGAMRETV